MTVTKAISLEICRNIITAMGKLVFPFQPIDLTIVYPGEYQMPMEDAKSIDESPLSISEVCALLFHGHSHEGSFD